MMPGQYRMMGDRNHDVARQCRNHSVCAARPGSLLRCNVVLDTPAGVAPIYTPQSAMAGGLIAPPPGTTPPVPMEKVSRSGSYTGTAFPLETGRGICVNTLTVSNFNVRGNAVRFGRFRGPSTPMTGCRWSTATSGSLASSKAPHSMASWTRLAAGMLLAAHTC